MLSRLVRLLIDTAPGSISRKRALGVDSLLNPRRRKTEVKTKNAFVI